MKACNNYIQVQEVNQKEGFDMGENNLKEGTVISIGEKCLFENMDNGDMVVFKIGEKVLFDTNKSLKHGGFWFLKGNSVFAYDGN